MLVWLLELFAAGKPAEWAWRQPAPRALTAAWLCLCATVGLAPCWLAWLATYFREPLKTPCAALRELHRSKTHTPTMGGLIIVGALLAALLLLSDLRSPLVQATLCATLGLAAVGAADDLCKLRRTCNGLRPLPKLLLGLPSAGLSAWLIYVQHRAEPGGLALWLPWVGEVDLGAAYLLLAVLVILCSAHAVNLTDGLDGLAGGCVLMVLLCLGLVVWCGGQGWSLATAWAWLEDPRQLWNHGEAAGGMAGPAGLVPFPGGGETLVAAGAAAGAVAGFLWFNRHPARVFMGDTGSLSLGGLLAVLALANRLEWLLLVAGGVFVAEAGSVVVQLCIRRLWGKRWLRCAPLHHHFELGGWPETRVVRRFWMAAVLCAAAALGLTQAAWQSGAEGPHVVARHAPPGPSLR
ncbi:MAG: phospho-N-acetylmuramoyl-pentapeptide-transferase [Pirellulales bacterium]|nr:phospho-N-acetylmuramoyl-pentapeptide-transferase [Pirellulales bacterium]